MKQSSKGFTIVELVIVTIIVAILVVIGIGVTLRLKRDKKYDEKKKADITIIETKLEDYFVYNSAYPGNLAELTAGSEPYLATLPLSPDGTKYAYTPSPASCTGTTCTSYVISVQISNQREAISGNVENCPPGAGTGKCYVLRSSQ